MTGQADQAAATALRSRIEGGPGEVRQRGSPMLDNENEVRSAGPSPPILIEAHP